MTYATNSANSITKLEKFQVLERVTKDYTLYKKLPIEYQYDRDISLLAISLATENSRDTSISQHELRSLFKSVPKSLTNDKLFLIDIFKSLVKFFNTGTGIIPCFRADLLSDKQLALVCLDTYPESFKLLGENLKDDLEVVKRAIEVGGSKSLVQASKRLQNNYGLWADIALSDRWGWDYVNRNKRNESLARSIYAQNIEEFFVNYRENGFPKEMAGYVGEIIRNPQQSQDFYKKAISRIDASIISSEILKEDQINRPTSFKANSNLQSLINQANRNIESNFITMEHLANFLTLEELLATGCHSKTFKERIVKRKETLEVKQDADLIKVNKPPRKLFKLP